MALPQDWSTPSPRDEEERRIYLLHEIFRKTLDGRFLAAPIRDPVGRVLDLGSGSGIWACQLAAENSTCEVVGLDLFKPDITAPHNCSLVIRDAEKDWDIGAAKFDVIHTRIVPWRAEHFPGVLRRCYEHLKPGGYVELQEMWPPLRTEEPQDSSEDPSVVIRWGRLRSEAAAKLGIDQKFAGSLPDMLSKAGFVEIGTEDHKWPIGSWAQDEKSKNIGNMFLDVLQQGKMEYSRGLLSVLGMGEHEIIDMVEEVGKELGIGKIYSMTRFVWARRPE